MADENKAVVKPVVKKSCWFDIDKTHWFIKLFLAAVIAAFILTLGVVMADSDSRHAGKTGFGYRMERGKNVMYFNKEAVGAGGGFATCPMMQSFIQGVPATGGTVSTFATPATGAVTISGSATINPYEISDLAAVFMTSGTVTTVTATKLSLTDGNKVEKIINIGANTVVKSGEVPGQISDIKVGDNISVVNLPDTDGAMTAELIRILTK